MKSPPSYPNPALATFRYTIKALLENPYFFAWRIQLQVVMQMAWKVRVYNRHFEPTRGGAVYISNHQSFLDPILMSFALRRQMSYMARDSLFKYPGFKQLIESANAFPLRRGTADLGAMKEAMRRLKAGRQLVIFPEGTRTSDGRIGELLLGAAVLAQRAADWTVPVVVDGAFECWPRTRPLPGSGNIVVQYGRPISQAEARSKTPEEFVADVRNRLIEIQSDIRRRLGRPEIKYE